MKKDKSASLIKQILRLFKNVYATAGEFTVMDKGSISFEVKCKNPDKLIVCFADPQPVPIPCVPFVPDVLLVEFIKYPGALSTVIISWEVSEMRTVAWSVR